MAYRIGTRKEEIMNLPNKITISRIIIIFLTIIAMVVLAFIPGLVVPNLGNTNINIVYFIFTIVFIIAAFTDFLDGQIARRCNLVTDFGKFLDPIADKLLNDAMMIFILVPQSYASNQRHNELSLTVLMVCVILMIARDLVVDGLRLVAVQKGKVIAANIFGKCKTVLQMISIPILLLNGWPFSYFDSSWPEVIQVANILFYLATFASLASGIIYVIQNKNILKKDDIDEQLFNTLKEKHLSLGAVESITGGLFSSSITSIAGASQFFKGSLITYTAEEKMNLAHVNKNTISNYSVVSDEVAKEMALGGKEVLRCDLCVAVTGNAGPTSDIGDKPVGEVHIALAYLDKVSVYNFNLKGNRKHIQSMCVHKMKELILFSLNDNA